MKRRVPLIIACISSVVIIGRNITVIKADYPSGAVMNSDKKYKELLQLINPEDTRSPYR